MNIKLNITLKHDGIIENKEFDGTFLNNRIIYNDDVKVIIDLENKRIERISDDYKVEIISTYKIEETPAFDINPSVKVKYLITKYKPNRAEWKASIKKLRPIKFIKETYKAIVVLINRSQKTKEAISKCDSDIIISTRSLFDGWVSKYAKSSIYKIAWEHNHHHNDIKYANKVVESCKYLDTLVLVSDSLRNYYKKESDQILRNML